MDHPLNILLAAEVGWTSGIIPEHSNVDVLLKQRGLHIVKSSALTLGLRESTYTIEVISPKVLFGNMTIEVISPKVVFGNMTAFFGILEGNNRGALIYKDQA